MSRLHSLGRRGLKWVSAASDVLRPPGEGVVILLYHRVGRCTPVEVDLPRALFDEQMAMLHDASRVISLDETVGLLSAESASDLPSPLGSSHQVSAVSGVALHERAVAVTFDDGTADFLDVTLPILVRHQIPATLYVATRFIDEGRWFPDGGRPASWAGLREAVSTGLVTVGSHTHSHRLLDRVDASEAAGELDRSIGLIEEHLGVSPDHFAYPKALAATGPTEQEVRQRFRSAALAGSRVNLAQGRGSADVHRLGRTPIQCSDQMRWFRAKAAGGFRLEGELRERRSARRYAGATT